MKGGKTDLEITLKQRLDSVLKEIKVQQSLDHTYKSGNSQSETKSKWQFIEMLRKDKKKNFCGEDIKPDSNCQPVKKSKHSLFENLLETNADNAQDSDIQKHYCNILAPNKNLDDLLQSSFKQQSPQRKESRFTTL